MLNTCTGGMTCHLLVLEEETSMDSVVSWLSLCFQRGGESEPIVFPEDLLVPLIFLFSRFIFLC